MQPFLYSCVELITDSPLMWLFSCVHEPVLCSGALNRWILEPCGEQAALFLLVLNDQHKKIKAPNMTHAVIPSRERQKIQTPAEAKKKRECLVFFYIFCNQNIRLTALAAHGMAFFVWNQLLQVQEMWETYREVTAADVFLFLMYLWSSWSSAIRPLLCFLQRHKQRSTTSLDAP